MPGGEAALAVPAVKAVVGILLLRSTSDFFFKWKHDTSLLDKLRKQVDTIQTLRNVAEMKLIEDNSDVLNWFEDVRFAICDAEDLMEKIYTDILKEKVNNPETINTLKSMVKYVVEKLDYKRKDILRTIHPCKQTRESQMREIIQTLKDLASQKGDLGLEKDAGLAEFRQNRITTSSDNKHSEIIGRSENEREIIELLKWSEGVNDALRVIPIVGLGGIGKTTLASMVYNRYDTSEFQVKAWVCVSDKFDFLNVINSLLQLITKRDSMAIQNLEFCQNKLKEALEKKRFLLVLDDVWIDIKNKWEILRNIFLDGAPGSRIIVTTRDHNVAKIVSRCDGSSYELNALSNAQCWSLFQRHAFQNGDSSTYPRLETIGKKIADKCKGLPLAVKMLGRSLFLKGNDEKEWNFVLESRIWNSKTGILPSLWLSYYHLPQPVKECFAYLSMFPKDYLFKKEEIILLWVAEGFVQKGDESSSGSSNYEHVARTYFEHLHQNFFIQQSGSGFVQKGDESSSGSSNYRTYLEHLHPNFFIQQSYFGFVMHDLVHDLAQHVSKGLVVNMNEVNPKSRRLFHIGSQGEMPFSSTVQQVTTLRTLLLRENAYISVRYSGLFSKLKLLRVLSLEGCNISKLPDSIVNMELLKYLNVSWTKIECLPDWICQLYNLQVLQISYCLKLRSLPARLFDRSNLRHLMMEGTPLEQMPDGIGRMKNLQTLSQYVIGEGKSKQMREFRGLCDLSRKLSILKLNHVDDPENANTARFENKKYLEELVLEWEETEDRDTSLDELVLDAMKPHTNLKRLTIKEYGGEKFSKWVARISDSFTDIVSLCIGSCINCKALPPLGNLTHLKNLEISGLNCVESLDLEFYGENAFKALEILEIGDMEVLKTWYIPRGGFNSLKELQITNCPQLTEISYCFPSLNLLIIMNCNNLFQLKMNEGSVPCGDSLRSIWIKWCEKLIEIPTSIVNLVSIRIQNCKSLVSVPELHHVQDLMLSDVMLTSEAALRNCVSEGEDSSIVPEVDRMKRRLPLNILEIHGGDNLDNCNKFLTTHKHNLTSLTDISIVRFASLDSLHDVEWPSTLKYLSITECDGLATIPDQFIRGCSKSLKQLRISYCRNIKCLPSTLLTVNLSNLLLLGLEALESLPDGFHNITSLVTLDISECPRLIFPRNGFPDSLKTLIIESYYKILSMSEMKLQNLNSLTELKLRGFDADTFTGDQCLPNSIKSLYIAKFPHLKSLSGVVPRLPHLSNLQVFDCPLISNKSWSNMLKLIPEQCWAERDRW